MNIGIKMGIASAMGAIIGGGLAFGLDLAPWAVLIGFTVGALSGYTLYEPGKAYRVFRATWCEASKRDNVVYVGECGLLAFFCVCLGACLVVLLFGFGASLLFSTLLWLDVLGIETYVDIPLYDPASIFRAHVVPVISYICITFGWSWLNSRNKKFLEFVTHPLSWQQSNKPSEGQKTTKVGCGIMLALTITPIGYSLGVVFMFLSFTWLTLAVSWKTVSIIHSDRRLWCAVSAGLGVLVGVIAGHVITCGIVGFVAGHIGHLALTKIFELWPRMRWAKAC